MAQCRAFKRHQDRNNREKQDDASLTQAAEKMSSYESKHNMNNEMNNAKATQIETLQKAEQYAGTTG